MTSKQQKIVRFKISKKGKLSFQDGFLIKSGDYYSSNNYASRLLNKKFVTYIPVSLPDDYPSAQYKGRSIFPQIAKIKKGSKKNLVWKDLVSYKDITKPLQSIIYPTLHTVLTCDPLSYDFSCDAKSIISSSKSEYYVSKDSFYLWTQAFSKELLYNFQFDDDIDFRYQLERNKNIGDSLDAVVFKIPIENKKITAIKVTGQPIDQFSFHEFNENLYMLLVNGRSKDKKELAGLYSLPINRFDELASYSADYIDLGPINRQANNRFSQNHLIIGTSTTFNYSRQDGRVLLDTFDASIYNLDSQIMTSINTGHTADRIEVADDMVFVSGLNSKGDYEVSIIDPKLPAKTTGKIFPQILENESRSPAFNTYWAEENVMLMGITAYDKEDAEYNYGPFNYQWDDNQSSDIFLLGLDTDNDYMFEAGKLNSSANGYQPTSKECEVSCYDWYGNTRPFFLRGRIFGLSGDELFEGSFSNHRIHTIKQVNLDSAR